MSPSSVFDGPFLAVPRWAVQRATDAKRPVAIQVLCVLIDHMNIRTKHSEVSIKEIAEQANISRETVKRTLKWMEDEGLIAKKNSEGMKNRYHVRYVEVGSPMSLGGVTHEPTPGSPMSLGGVMGEPSSTPENDPLAGETPFHYRIVLESSTKKIEERIVCDDEEGKPMILGADPERSAQATKTPAKGRKNSPQEELVRRFIHSRAFCMYRFAAHDMMILRRAIRLLLQSGLTTDTVRKMIDSFTNDTRFTAYDNPAKAFASLKVQKVLIDKINISVQDSDPVLMFMVDGFVRGDYELPWDSSLDGVLRKTVTTRSLESLYRFPPLVANLIRKWSGDFTNPDFINALTSLESLVRSSLGMESADREELLNNLSFLPLPKSLLTGSLTTESADTLSEAVYTNRRRNSA